MRSARSPCPKMTVSGNEYSRSQHFVPEMKGFWAPMGFAESSVTKTRGFWARMGCGSGGQRCRSKQDRACSPIVLLGDLPLTYPYTAPAAGNNLQRFSSPAALAQPLRNESLSANGGGRSEGRRPRAAGYVRGRAPDEMTGIRQDASSPAALAQRQDSSARCARSE